mgnify:CR=1 FL=1
MVESILPGGEAGILFLPAIYKGTRDTTDQVKPHVDNRRLSSGNKILMELVENRISYGYNKRIFDRIPDIKFIVPKSPHPQECQYSE